MGDRYGTLQIFTTELPFTAVDSSYVALPAEISQRLPLPPHSLDSFMLTIVDCCCLDFVADDEYFIELIGTKKHFDPFAARIDSTFSHSERDFSSDIFFDVAAYLIVADGQESGNYILPLFLHVVEVASCLSSVDWSANSQ